MKLTEQWLNERFDYNNRTYFVPLFGVELERPKFLIKSLKRWGGYFVPRQGKPIIAMSNFCEYTEEGNEDTLLHEMIHEYIWQTKIKDNKVHGREFIRIMETINANGGNVTIETQLSSVIGYDNAPKEVVLVAYQKKGGYFVCRIAPTKADLYWKHIMNNPKRFINPYLLKSSDDEFKTWRTCRKKFMGYYYTLKEFNGLLTLCKVVNRATTLL